MGRKNKEYSKDLHQQVYEKLVKMQAFGDSKKDDMNYDKKHDTDISSEKIYSFATYTTYFKHIKYFIKWVQEEHPECKTIKKAQKYVATWLQIRTDYKDENGKGLSAWTIQTEAAALNKLYHIKPNDPKRFQPPRRKREDITRSRGSKTRDKHFSEKTNEELINFCKGCGFRRGVLEKLTGNDLYSKEQILSVLKSAKQKSDLKTLTICKDALKYFPDQDMFILHRNDKGGKSRFAPIIGPNKDKIIKRIQNTPNDKKVWEYVSSNCDVHGYRSDYATYLYKHYARPSEQLDYKKKIRCADGKYRSEVYICRNDEKGKRLDRLALRTVSKALGHNREDTAISNYIRNL